MAGSEAHVVEADELTVLIIGQGEPLVAGVQEALERRNLAVMTAPSRGSIQAAIAMAPDLVMLVGDAASGGGRDVLSGLAASPLAAVLPVVILADDEALGDRLKAFRFGATAVVPRSASVDAIANRVAALAREIPERNGAPSGELGEATLDDFVAMLSSELRAGILSVKPHGSVRRGDTVRIVLGEGRTVADVIENFVAKVRPLIQQAELVDYELLEQPGGTVQLFGAEDAEQGRVGGDIGHMRILLADDDVARADAVAQELRARGAAVVMTDLGGSRLERARDVDPSVLIIGERAVHGGEGYRLVRSMREDTRLRWAFMLVVSWEEVWSPSSPGPVVDRMVGRISQLGETEGTLRQRAIEGSPFDARLEATGPARLLRALSHGKATFKVSITNPRAAVRVDFSEGLVAGATCELKGPAGETKKLYGPAALAALLAMAHGKVRIEPVESPAAANIMSTVDGALSAAQAEETPLRPSTIARRPEAEDYLVAQARLTPAQAVNRPAITQHGLPTPEQLASRTGTPIGGRTLQMPAVTPPPKVTLGGVSPRGGTRAKRPASTYKPAAPRPAAAQPAPAPKAPEPAATEAKPAAPRAKPAARGTAATASKPAASGPAETATEAGVTASAGAAETARRRRRQPTLVGMPAPSREPEEPRTGPVQNPDHRPPGFDEIRSTHSLADRDAAAPVPTDAAAAAAGGAEQSDEGDQGETQVDIRPPELDAARAPTDPAPPPKANPTMPLATEDIEYAQRPPALPEHANPFGVRSPPAAQANPTMPLSTVDIEYPQQPPAPPVGTDPMARLRRDRARRMATYVMAGGVALAVVLGVVVIGWLVAGTGDEEAPVLASVTPEKPPRAEKDTAGPVSEEAEAGEEAAAGEEEDVFAPADEEEDPGPAADRAPAAAAGSVVGAVPDAQVTLPPVPRRIQRLPEVRRERTARRFRIRGAQALRRGQWPLALRQYRAALVQDPQSGEAHKGYAVALYRQRRFDEAIAWMRRALELEPGQATWYVLLGDAYRESGDLESARAAWRHALTLDRQNQAARMRLR